MLVKLADRARRVNVTVALCATIGRPFQRKRTCKSNAIPRYSLVLFAPRLLPVTRVTLLR